MDNHDSMFRRGNGFRDQPYFNANESARKTMDDDGFYSASFNEDDRYNEGYGEAMAPNLKAKKRSHQVEQEARFGLPK